MQFHQKRRQQFLGESHYRLMLEDAQEGINNIESIIAEAVSKHDYDYANDRASFQGFLRLQRLFAHYTAGEPIAPLRSEIETVVAAYERYGEYLWKHTGDRNDWVFDFDFLDAYCALMQLVGLCFLLHRRDLLPRIASLQDGLDAVGKKGEGAGGADWIFEEFLSFAVGPENRYESETIHWPKPYEALADAMSSPDNDQALKDISLFLKHWYKDLSGTGWHDSHKPNEAGDQAGYYGYWSFEAGAAVLLLDIEDDNSLHQYLYYPKDLVAWARAHSELSATDVAHPGAVRLRAEAGQPCPREGWWFTPASPTSRRKFAAGEAMPVVNPSYGINVWQWDTHQDT